jgi:excisionase family DNA binding protein
MPNLDLLTIARAAELLGESRNSTARRVAAGELSATKLDGRKGAHLLQRSEVVALAEQLQADRREASAAIDAKLAQAKTAMSS